MHRDHRKNALKSSVSTEIIVCFHSLDVLPGHADSFRANLRPVVENGTEIIGRRDRACGTNPPYILEKSTDIIGRVARLMVIYCSKLPRLLASALNLTKW